MIFRQWHYAQGGRQIGPISQMELMALIRTGQVRPEDLVWSEGMDDWTRADMLPELWDIAPAGHIPIGRAEPKGSGLAIASLICGILGFCCCVTPIPAIVCGHIALSQINREPGRYRGRGMAVAGLILGYISLAFQLISVVYALLMGNGMSFNWMVVS